MPVTSQNPAMPRGRHLRPAELTGRLTPRETGLRQTSIQRLHISTHAQTASGDEEVLLVIIAGQVTYRCGEHTGTAEARDMLYLPVDRSIELNGDAVVMRFGAPCDRETAFAHIAFADVDADDRHKRYGTSELGTRRDVWNFIDEDFDSSRLLAGFTQGAPGGWTAWPPHEHGAAREETYIYFGMGDGFGVQLVYDEDAMDSPSTVALVRDGDVVTVPGGYHPSSGSPAGGISYAYVMASHVPEKREFMDLRIQPLYGTTFD
jgi:5-deoxy-glucuronate isomerase